MSNALYVFFAKECTNSWFFRQNTELKNIPASWAKISGTKKVSRFHTPAVVKMIRERDQHKESLSSACDAAFHSFLAEIGSHYALLRDSISSLATLDCLMSLAIVAALPGYTKPSFLSSSETIVNITDGRHPSKYNLGLYYCLRWHF